MKLRLLSTKLGSKSLKLVAEGLSKKLGYKVWRSSKQKPNRKHLVYGDQKDKLYQYKWFSEQGIAAPPFTVSKDEANTWLEKGSTILARHLLRASEGKGITVVEKGATIPSAPVYTKYIPKKVEFRVHIFQDKVVSVVEKRRKKETYAGESKIRNTANGYVFCHQGVVEPEGLRELALKARKVTASDFAGVDIGWNQKKNLLFVIEVNSAPGIQGSNISAYVEEIANANS